MENENFMENIPEVSPDPVEGEESIPDSTPDVLPDETDMENGEEATPDVPADETGGGPSILVPEEGTPEEEAPEEEVPETGLPEEEAPEEEAPEETPEEEAPEEETGETENENIYEMENGNEDFYGSVSVNDFMGDGPDTGSPATYVTYNYTTEVLPEEVIPLWENNISNFSTSEMLLFLIFLLLLVQFVHKIFKGSHWMKG